MQRRHRLQEAIPPSAPEVERPSLGSSAESADMYPQAGLDTHLSQERLEYLGSRMVLPLDSASNFDRTLVGAFLDIYLPSNAYPTSGPMRIWLHEAIDFNDSGRALRPSLRALSLNRVGWANNDKALIMQGRVAYNLALHELQKALRNRDEMYRDETLAAARALMAYDVSRLLQANAFSAYWVADLRVNARLCQQLESTSSWVSVYRSDARSCELFFTSRASTSGRNSQHKRKLYHHF